MKAATYKRFGDHNEIEIEEVQKPKIGSEEILVNVHASSVNQADWLTLTGNPKIARAVFGIFSPKKKILGMDLAGTIVAVGENVTRFKSGDKVFGESTECFAEYTCVSEHEIALAPEGLPDEQVAALPLAGLTALNAVRDQAKVQDGHSILVIGGSGGVGTFTVQIAKIFGASVTAVCSTENIDLMHSIGADAIVDYKTDDFTKSNARFHAIIDIVGSGSLRTHRRLLRDDGVYVAVAVGKTSMGVIGRMLRIALLSKLGSKKMLSFVSSSNSADLGALRDLVENSNLKPIIQRSFSLTEVAEAMRLQGEGHTKGKTVIKI